MTLNTNPPKVLHLLPHDAWGGAETAARSAAEADHLHCDLVVMFLAGRSLATRRGRIIDHPQRSLNGPTTYLAAVREVIKLQPDILVCSLWRSVLVGILVKLLRPRISFVCFLHNTVPEHFADNIVHVVGLRMADEVWADSAATLSARHLGAKRTRKISFITMHPNTKPAPELAPKFVSWSRLHSQKGHDRAIHLINELVQTGVDARLEIWGADYGEATALKQLTQSLSLEERIKFRGPLRREDIAGVASQNSFFLQLSRYEGMGMAVVEAMQLGLVPVVTAVGQISQYVRNGETGIIVDPNELGAAAEEVKELLAHREELLNISKAARMMWLSDPIYADDICDAAVGLAIKRRGIG